MILVWRRTGKVGGRQGIFLRESGETNAHAQKHVPQETALYLENFILKNDSIESMRLFNVKCLRMQAFDDTIKTSRNVGNEPRKLR